MSWLHMLNYYFLQWLFLRLYKIENEETGKVKKWGIMVVWPMSGYRGTKFKYLFRK